MPKLYTNFLVCFLLVVFAISCKKRFVFSNVQSIKVYSIPFGVQSINDITKQSILETTPILIVDDQLIHKIENELNKLVEEKNKGSFSSVFLVGNIYLDNGDMVEIIFNNFNFKINGQTYNRSIKLLELLAPNRDIHMFKLGPAGATSEE